MLTLNFLDLSVFDQFCEEYEEYIMCINVSQVEIKELSDYYETQELLDGIDDKYGNYFRYA